MLRVPTNWLLGAFIAVLVAGAPIRAGDDVDLAPRSARGILRAAFEIRYGVDLISKIDLVIRNRSGQERRRRFHAVSKVIDDRVHSVGRLIWPEYVRGMTILTMESGDGSHDAFVYMPSLGRVRRVSTAQRNDSFLGSDVTYRDLERQRVEEFGDFELRGEDFRRDEVFVVSARSMDDSSFSKVEFVIAQSDSAILETRYFKAGQRRPYRVITAPREGMVAADGHVIPTRLRVANRLRGTWTEVLFSDLEINPPIEREVFSIFTLDQERALPGDSRLER